MDDGRDTSKLDALRRLPQLLAAGMRLLWSADRRVFLALFGIQLLSGLAVGVQLLVAQQVLRELIAAATTGSGIGNLVGGVIVLVVTTAVIGFGYAAQPALARLLGELSVVEAFRLIFKATSRADLRAYDEPEFCDRLQRARVNTLAPQQICAQLATVGNASFIVIGVIVALGIIQPLLIPLVLVGFIPVLIATTRSSRELYDFAFGFAQHDRRMMYLDSLLTGKDPAAEVRAYGLYDFLLERHKAAAGERLGNVRRLARAEVRRVAAASGASALVRGATLVLVGWLMLSGHLSAAAAAVAAVGVQLLAGRLDGLSASFTTLYQNVLFLDDLMVFLDDADARGEQVDQATDAATEIAPFDELRVEDVHFSYPHKGDGPAPEALAGVSLSIRRGEVVALVGENGSGKTTLAKLLCHLYRPSGGRVLWDGVDTAGVELRATRMHTSVILQDFQKYQFSVWENIVAGRPEAGDDREAVRRAARLATADEFLSALPNGYDTTLSNQWRGGTDLSIGQWQRVAIARAVFRDAEFLVLDEPTAALDARAEQEIFEAVERMREDRTVLFISHRFSTVRHADRIYVLDKGQIVEAGSHAELIAQHGRYHEMFTLQASAYTDKTAADLVGAH